MARSLVARLPIPVTGEAKLTLLETLLASEDPVECAERAAEWLSDVVGAEEVLCFTIPPGPPQLAPVAWSGLGERDVAGMRIDLEDRHNPFVAAVFGGQVVVFEQTRDWKRRYGRLPLAAETLMLMPIRGLAGDEVPVGALLASPVSARVASEGRWIADCLGRKLAVLRRLESLTQVEQRLSRQAAQLQRIINAVSDPILLTDVEGRMIISNSRAEALLASLDGESEGRRRAVALNNMLLSAALPQAIIGGTGITRREVPLVDPTEGSDLLFELIATVVDDVREGTGIVSVLRNVTDLRRATEELEANLQKLKDAEETVRAERDRLDLIIDSVADPIVVSDPNGNNLLMNTPAERLFTLDPSGPSEGAQRAVRANDASLSSFVSNAFLGTEARWSADLPLVDPATSEHMPFEAVAGRIVTEQGELSAVVTILHDRREALERARLYEQLKLASSELERKVTEATAELVRQNELLQRQHLALEQASKLKSQFLANVSHEFRTPLNAILGYTSMLLQGIGGDLAPQQKKSLERVDSNGRHLLDIINDILDISKIEAGRATVELSDFTMAELIAEVMAEMEPLIARSKLDVRTSLSKDLPVVHADRKKLKQIIVNLMSNALKFTRTGSIVVSGVRLKDAGEVELSVADTGIGIAAEDHQKIFEDFRQVDSSPTREYGGTGLGLAICRRLAALMGARLGVRSELGKGSTFFVTIPIRCR